MVEEENNALIEESAPRMEAEVPSARADGLPDLSEFVKQVNEPPPAPPVIVLNELQDLNITQLYALADTLGLRVAGARNKHQLIFEIACQYNRRGSVIHVTGVMEVTREGFGIVRDPRFNFIPFQDDVFITPSNLRRFNLVGQNGIKLKVAARAPNEQRERFICVDDIIEIEGLPAKGWTPPVIFDKLTAMFPVERIILENTVSKSVGPRVVDIVAPLGKGQRGLICAPPRGGKTVLLKDIAFSIQKNHPEISLIVLLINERPEEVTDFTESVGCQVFSSTFDEAAGRHIQVAELVLERARRLVEHGKDVVILLDSLTRLARGYNNMSGGKGPAMSGGIDATALQKSRKFFGSARKVDGGGSLTILATALIETDSKGDEVIFEEFKGTGNLEIQLDRELMERRIYPAIHVQKSGTRKDDLLYHPDEFRRIGGVRKQMAALPAGEAMEVLIKNIKATKSNAEMLLTGLRT